MASDPKEPRCYLCEQGFPLLDGQHIPTQSLGMIPVTPCRAASPLPAEPPPTTELPTAEPHKEREHCNQCGAPILREGERHAIARASIKAPMLDYAGADEPPKCQSGRDGECDWSECPQKKNYQIYCPYAAYWEAIWEKQMG